MPPRTTTGVCVVSGWRLVVAVPSAALAVAAALPPGLSGVHPARATTTTPGPGNVASPTVVAPVSGTLLGAHVNPRNGADQLTSINAFQAEIGRRLDLANSYHAFTDHTYRVEAALLATGRTPMISWRGTDSVSDPNRAAKIAAGQYDEVIRQTADAVRALERRVLLRFNWEMDQPPGDRQYIGTPSQFVAAWRRIVTIFRERGAANAAFVWAPRAGAFSKGVAGPFYPGLAYVDWFGASAVPTQSWPSFESTFRAFYGWAAPSGKPLLVWAGVRENPSAPLYKAGWMASVATTLQGSMPRVKAFVYYHALSPLGYAFWADTSPQALAAYKALGCRPYFDTARTCPHAPHAAFGPPPAAVATSASSADVFFRGSDSSLQHAYSRDGGASYHRESLGGLITDTPAVVARAQPELRYDAFVRGTNGYLYHAFYSGGWHAYQRLGARLGGRPSVVSWAPGRLDVFYLGAGASLGHTWYDGGWHAEALTPMGTLGGRPTAVSAGAGSLDVFYRGADGTLRHAYYNATSRGWRHVNLTGQILGDPAVNVQHPAGSPAQTRVFVRGASGAPYVNLLSGATSGGFTRMGGVLGSDPAATSWPGRFDMVAAGTDANLYHWASAGSGYTPPQRAVGPLTGTPAAVVPGTGRIDVYYRGLGGTLMRVGYDASSNTWTAAQSLGGGFG